MLTSFAAEAEASCMKRERIQKKVDRERDRAVALLPLTTRETFYPYPIRRTLRPQRTR
jgi:hypothetical protein